MRRLPASLIAAAPPSSCQDSKSVAPIAASASSKKLMKLNKIFTVSRCDSGRAPAGSAASSLTPPPVGRPAG